MPQLVRYFIVHGAIGAGIAAAVIAILFVYNLGDIRSLVMSSAGNLIAFSTLAVILATIFGAIQISMFVMLQPWDEQD